MSIFLLVLGLLMGPQVSRAQEPTSIPLQPVQPELGLQPSAPDANPPTISEPIGVPQPNPDFKAEMERASENTSAFEHRDEDIGHGTPINGGAVTHISTRSASGKLRIAKMQKGPEIAKENWKKGHWFHGKHDGSFAWWWVVDTTWFRYTKYVYPFPDHEQRQVFIPHAGTSGSTSLSSVAPPTHH